MTKKNVSQNVSIEVMNISVYLKTKDDMMVVKYVIIYTLVHHIHIYSRFTVSSYYNSSVNFEELPSLNVLSLAKGTSFNIFSSSFQTENTLLFY